jgi:hypothetical protein
MSKLFEKLRRLGQSIERTMVKTGRDEIVSGAFGGRDVENRGLHFQEAVRIEIFVGQFDDLGPGPERS